MREKTLALASGPCIATIVYIALPTHFTLHTESLVPLSQAARVVLAMGSWMALWWITEAIPVAATALLPIVMFPLLGVNSLESVSGAYAHPLIFLFFGGFLLSIAIEKWQLHAWMAARVAGAAAGDLRRLVGGFMLVSAFVSMWLSNTATAIMMLPIALSIVTQVERDATPVIAENFATCLLLGVAYAASIGGMATLIGSPPNLFVASFLQDQMGITVDFRLWMLAAAPVVVVLLPLTWLALTRIIAPIGAEYYPLGSVTNPLLWRDLPPAAKRVAGLFALAVLAWLFRSILSEWQWGGIRPLTHLTDTGVAMLAGLSLFILPTGVGEQRILEWRDVEKLPFGTLILFGGGLALAGAVRATGADQLIGAQLTALGAVPHWVIVAAVVSVVVFLTELTSNVATTTTLVPILAAGAVALGLEPLGLIIVTALAASAAFMMPVATPPNAIIFSAGRVPIRTMARAGLLINILAIVVIALVALFWIPRVVAAEFVV